MHEGNKNFCYAFSLVNFVNAAVILTGGQTKGIRKSHGMIGYEEGDPEDPDDGANYYPYVILGQ